MVFVLYGIIYARANEALVPGNNTHGHKKTCANVYVALYGHSSGQGEAGVTFGMFLVNRFFEKQLFKKLQKHLNF